ncbi:iron-sulfur cluster carrier protein ApbC [Rickettsiella grylli]|uniref:Iron-sulfur cluster carrier protein n=1 Tax=Rickettsiella grylli TaxID=59196 RepID=A8PKV8_9COXI|nr:iron-sulfur cluster carrier protein ApbC [Rickettsiella grylli]EDP46003.1 Mrp protein [Rickettsiella grylli]
MLSRANKIKHIIAIASGKGGVGKSTTAVNLALALAEVENKNVGILDADIYGPNQPQMLGVNEKPTSKDGKTLEPVYAHGLQSMSIGYLIDASTPMIWRGPMATGALQQLLNDTHWNNLDYLVVDLPPGTGDIQLTLTQKIPLSGAVIVTTPQDIALLDVRKAIGMFNKVKVPLLGIVENMCMYACRNCGHKEPIFGHGGGERLAKAYDMRLLGTLPLDGKIREQADVGTPIFLAEPQGAIADIYRKIAREITEQLNHPKTKTFRFPKIVIDKE